jgi:hypothetical protein
VYTQHVSSLAQLEVKLEKCLCRKKSSPFCDITTCNPADFLIPVLFYPEDGGDMFLRNV